MRSVILVMGALGVVGSSVVLASSPRMQEKEKQARPTLAMHRDGCQKCHGAEGELMSPGWAENRSRQDLVAILDQMVVEQAGLPEMTARERDALLSFHLAFSKGDPWANILDSSSQKVVLESTKNSRISATLSGKKVAPQPVGDQKSAEGSQLLRWQITLPKGALPSQLHLTVAWGSGSAKKVVSWKASERPFSQSL